MKGIVEQIKVASKSNTKRIRQGKDPIEYTVTVYSDGSWACGCPSWTQNTPRSDCKHILQLKLERATANGVPQVRVVQPTDPTAIKLGSVRRKFRF